MQRGYRWLPWLAALWLASIAGAHAAASGEAIALHGSSHGAPACVSCHGAHGEGNSAAGFPRLAGQPAAYLVKQLRDYAAGGRSSGVMQTVARGLSGADRAAVARYFAGQSVPAHNQVTASPDVLARGRELVVNGEWAKNMPACVACHGEGARGIAPNFPALAGQSPQYLATQLDDWRQGRRGNDADGLMKAVAMALTPDQVQAVSQYLVSLPATGQVPASVEPDVAPAAPDALPGYFQPPLRADLPKGGFGDSVRRGERIFSHTQAYAGHYLGDGLDCVNCHLNKGRQANSSPMWAAWVLYPAYRSKNHKVNTMAERIIGCFKYSENAQGSPAGHPPAADSQLMVDLESYMYWLASGAPTGKKMKGQGYGAPARPPRPFDPGRGARVYASHCVQCHGADGQGLHTAAGYVFPPLWGPHSYNWGAGMHSVDKAVAFIKSSMPLGRGGMLSDQQAWDVTAYIDSHPRPQDPRFNGNLQQTIAKYHADREMDYYGKTVNGRTLGAPAKAGEK